MNTWQRLVGYALQYRGRLAVAFLAMLAYGAGALAMPVLIKPVLDILSKTTTANEIRAAWIGGLILLAYVVKGIGSYVSDYEMTWVGQRAVMDIRVKLFRHVLDQSAAFFSRKTSGQLVSRITSDVTHVQRVVAQTVAELARESLALVGFVAYLFYIDWQLAIALLITAPLIVYPLVRFGQRVRSTTRRSQEDQEQIAHIANEAFTGHRIVKAFGAEQFEETKFTEASQRLFRTNMKVTSAVSALPPLMEIIGGFAIVGLLWYGMRQIHAGAMTAGDFGSFLAAAILMYGPMRKLSRVNADLQQGMAAGQRIFELMDRHTEVREREHACELPRLRAGVVFDRVGFSYDDTEGRHTLRDVSLEVGAGQVAAIVGLSGAGKTTLVNLIPRFYDVSEGAILIDGIDVRDVTLRSLRDQIALVTQETVLFDDTIAANIAFGRQTASPGEIENAARAAHAHDFIMAQPRGYDTRIGERGQRLSGGQRQRLAIARALLKDSPLLILDEATSSLDAESEGLVQDALATLMKNRTTFVIAHRLSTVRRADMIIALEKGRVVEIGRHDDLIARSGGVYARLYSLQSFDQKRSERQAAKGIS
ncbi:MAG: ABC transporter ATP-binding protein/permease [Acidobacteriota bacterium]|nr:ABC transporter ATP-binding protein/permease [Acidobacteriota bacterium]